jgi:uncharacterized membrane protein YhaH (DUF805 family)
VIDPRYLFLGLHGRITRGQFWLGMGALSLVQFAVMTSAEQVAGVNAADGNLPLWLRNLSLGLDVVSAWPIFAVLSKRQQDRSQTAHLSYLFVALLLLFSTLEAFNLTQIGPRVTPLGWFVGLPLLFTLVVVIIELGCRRGTEGANAYGHDPLG